MTSSALGGFLQPTSLAPTQDKELDLSLQTIVVGITGLCGDLVRRRYQELPPKQPDVSVDWCAIGVTNTTREAGSPAMEHYSDEQGSDRLRRHETLDLLASFYGPNAAGYASALSDGLTVAQNREALFHLGMGYIDSDPLVNTSYLQNTQFLRKIDLHFRLRRRVERDYAVRNILGASGVIHKAGGSTQGSVTTDVPFSVKE